MEDPLSKVRWAPRVNREKIRRLYAGEAAGMLDEALLEEIAWAFYARCQSIIEVTDSEWGKVHCPACTAVFPRTYGEPETLRCPQCGWELPWRAFLKTYQGKQLSGGSAVGAFREYVRRLPETRAPEAKMLLVDWLVHEVHKYTCRGEVGDWWRPAACNLIDGNMRQLTDFLEELAGRPGNSPQLRASQEHWRGEVLPRLWSRKDRQTSF